MLGVGLWVVARQLMRALQRRRRRKGDASRTDRDPDAVNVVELLQIAACISGILFLGAFALTFWMNAPWWLAETFFALFLLSGLEALGMELLHTRLDAGVHTRETR